MIYIIVDVKLTKCMHDFIFYISFSCVHVWLCLSSNPHIVRIQYAHNDALIHLLSMYMIINTMISSIIQAIRTSAISVMGVMYMYMGAPLRVLFDGEKAALLQQIDAEIEKVDIMYEAFTVCKLL